MIPVDIDYEHNNEISSIGIIENGKFKNMLPYAYKYVTYVYEGDVEISDYMVGKRAYHSNRKDPKTLYYDFIKYGNGNAVIVKTIEIPYERYISIDMSQLTKFNEYIYFNIYVQDDYNMLCRYNIKTKRFSCKQINHTHSKLKHEGKYVVNITSFDEGLEIYDITTFKKIFKFPYYISGNYSIEDNGKIYFETSDDIKNKINVMLINLPNTIYLLITSSYALFYICDTFISIYRDYVDIKKSYIDFEGFVVDDK